VVSVVPTIRYGMQQFSYSLQLLVYEQYNCNTSVLAQQLSLLYNLC